MAATLAFAHALFGAEHGDWVNSHGEDHRRQRGQQRHCEKCQRRKRKYPEVVSINLVEQCFDIPHRRRTETQARNRSHKNHGENIDGHQSCDATSLSAYGHANADFASALQHRVVEHAVQADPRQHKRDNREKQGQHCEQPFADRVGLIDLELCTDAAYAELGAGARDLLPQSRSENERIGTEGAHDECRVALRRQ